MQHSVLLLAVFAAAAPNGVTGAYSHSRQKDPFLFQGDHKALDVSNIALEATTQPKFGVDMAQTGTTTAAQGMGATRLSTPWIIGICVAVVVIVAGAGGFFVYKRKKAAEEAKEADDAAAPLLADKISAAEPKAHKDMGDVDPATMLKLIVQAGMQKIGPKLAKGQAVRNVLENSLSNFAAKSKRFVLNELNCTAASLLQACEAEEAMLLLDLNQAVEANFPPAGALIAGALSPILITVRLIQHIMQPFAMIVPAAVGVWAIILDGQTYCAVPTIHWWLIAQTVVAFTLVIAHCLMFAKIRSGQRQMKEKAAQTVEAVGKVEGGDEMSVSHMRDMFVNYSVLLQEALIIENDVRQCVFNKVIGFGTIAWILIAFWNMSLIAGWTFIPGKVAFHESARESAGEDFCGAWRTVFALRLSVIIQVLFFFINIFVVIGFGSDSLIDSPKYADTLITAAKKMDDGHAGIPITQLLVKGVLLRGSSDTATARYNVIRDDQARLTREKYEIQKKLDAVTATLKTVDAKVDALRPQMEDDVGDLEEQIANLKDKAFNMDDWKATGQRSIEDAQSHAASLEAATTEAIEKIIAKITEAASAMQDSESGHMMAEKMAQLQQMKALQSAMQAAGQMQGQMPDMAAMQAAAAKMGHDFDVEAMQAAALKMGKDFDVEAMQAAALKMGQDFDVEGMKAAALKMGKDFDVEAMQAAALKMGKDFDVEAMKAEALKMGKDFDVEAMRAAAAKMGKDFDVEAMQAAAASLQTAEGRQALQSQAQAAASTMQSQGQAAATSLQSQAKSAAEKYK